MTPEAYNFHQNHSESGGQANQLQLSIKQDIEATKAKEKKNAAWQKQLEEAKQNLPLRAYLIKCGFISADYFD